MVSVQRVVRCTVTVRLSFVDVDSITVDIEPLRGHENESIRLISVQRVIRCTVTVVEVNVQRVVRCTVTVRLSSVDAHDIGV